MDTIGRSEGNVSGTYGWGRVLDYLGIEWEKEIGQIRGQMTIEQWLKGETNDKS